MSEAEWQEAKHRHPVESEVIAEITHVYALNREYWVRFDGVWAALPWTGPPPEVGANARFVVHHHLDDTRRSFRRRVGAAAAVDGELSAGRGLRLRVRNPHPEGTDVEYRTDPYWYG